MTDATPTLGDVLHAAISRRLDGVHTASVGQIASYDETSRTASVQPLVWETYIDEDGAQQSRRLPVVPRALVVFPRGYRATLVPGDVVVLVFTSQPLGRWIAGADGDPGSARRHAMTDAIAFPFERAGTIRGDVNVYLGDDSVVPFIEAPLPLDGVVKGAGVDLYSGLTYAALGSASLKVFVK